MAAVTLIGSVLSFNLLHKEPQTDPVTLCRTDQQLTEHRVVIVDATDPFAPDQAQRLRAAIDEERRALPKNGKLTVTLVTSEKPFEPTNVISLCNPGSADDANPLISNPRQIEEFWRERFADPINEVTNRLLKIPTALSSPILQTIAAVSWRVDFDSRIPGRHLRIISDMLQHEPGGYSHYRLGDPQVPFAKTGLATEVQTADLTGVTVKIDYLRRPEALQFQTDAQKSFWQQWFKDRGASQIDFLGF
jgi:hypothetical protein